MSTAQTPLHNRSFTLPGAKGSALLVHGLGGGPYEIQWLGEAIHAQTGLTVRAMHLPGHQNFAQRMPASKHEDWVEAVLAEQSTLAQHGPVHLVGFSTGSTICLRAAELLPEVGRPMTGRIVLLAPFIDIYHPPLLPVRPEVLLNFFSGLSTVPRRGPPLRDRALRHEVKACLPFTTMSLDAARSAKTLGDLVMRDLAKVNCPVLIIQGMRDTVVDPRGAARIEGQLRCERRLIMLEHSDHLVALDRERQRVFQEVSNYLTPT